MRLLRMIAVSFSLYSRIPMPHFPWRQEDMRLSLVFFPWIGAVCGLIDWAVFCVSEVFSLPAAVTGILLALIPVVVTGGFHLDGYMDTQDALHSYASAEKKLEILKDPHVGAFAVIHLVKSMLFFTALMIALADTGVREVPLFLSGIFFLARCLSGLTSCLMQKARPDGMLDGETKEAGPAVISALLIWLILGCAFLCYQDPAGMGAVLTAFALVTVYYTLRIRRAFGGVTGDTAGYYLVCAELAACLAYAIRLLAGGRL